MRLLVFIFIIILGISCTTSDKGLTGGYNWILPQGFPAPLVPEDNPMSAEKVELGRHLFYDTKMSVDGTFSCASCHKQEKAFTDDLAQAVGVTGELHPRSSMSLTNVGYNSVLAWANPTLFSLEKQALIPMFGETPVELGLVGKEEELLQAFRDDSLYQQLFGQAYPNEEDPFTLANLTFALASFQRILISGDSAYDRFNQGDSNALPNSAKRGVGLFFSEKFECFHCHGGFNFSQSTTHQGKAFTEVEFHNTGLYNIGGKGDYPADNTGIHEITLKPKDMGRFRAPTLRNIALTAPYMHDGSIETLRDVIVNHYAAGGRTIESGPNAGVGSKNPYKSNFLGGFSLKKEEVDDLIAFLESLTDESFINNPRFSNPFE